MVDSRSKAKLVLIPIFNVILSNSWSDCSLCNCYWNVGEDTRIEDRWDDVFTTEFNIETSISSFDLFRNWLPCQSCQCLCTCHLHWLIDLSRSNVKGCTEQEWEAEDVVNLIWIIWTACCDNSVFSDFIDGLGSHLRFGIGQCEDNWAIIHWLDHICIELSRLRKTNGNIRTFKAIRKCFKIISLLLEEFLVRVHSLDPSFINDTASIAHDAVFRFESVIKCQSHACLSCWSRSIHHQFNIFFLLTCNFEGINESCEADDGGTMLIIMEHWNVHLFLKIFFNIEAVWSLDIFEVDSSKRWLQMLDAFNKVVFVRCIDTEINWFNSGEFIEENSFALHDWLGGQGSNVAQS